MRILQALGWYFPESLGGTEVYVNGLSQRLRAAGHDVVVAAPTTASSLPLHYEHEGVCVYKYPIPAAPTRAECQGTVAVRGSEHFHAWLARWRPDVFHVHSFVTGLGLAEIRAAKVAGARVVVTVHTPGLAYVCQRGTLMRWGRRPCDGICRPAKCSACALQAAGLPRPLADVLGTWPPPLGRLTGRLPGKLGSALGMSALIERNQAIQCEILARVDRFVLLTRWALEAVAANGAPREKLVLNRLGLSQTHVVRKPGPELCPSRLPLTVGYLGRLDPIKGVLDLARAAAYLGAAVPVAIEFRGPVASAAERRTLDELRRITRSTPQVRFAPPVSPADVPQVLAGYDLLCCPSVCLEGGPTVAIEAHAVGTPVIGTRIGGLAEVVTEGINGRLVQPADWRALAETLQMVARDPTGTIDRWRRALPEARTLAQVSTDYLELYHA